DSRIDIVTVNSLGQSASALLGNGDGTFGVAQTSSLPVFRPSTLALGDVNGDAVPDIVAGGIGGAPVLMGNGDGTFASGPALDVPGFFAWDSALSDLDGDGDLDYVLGDEHGFLNVRLNDGSGAAGGGNVAKERSYSYDSVFHQLTSDTDELSRKMLYDVDPATGNRLAVTRVIGGIGGADDVTTHFTYTAQSLTHTQTHPPGRITHNDYDAQGRP